MTFDTCNLHNMYTTDNPDDILQALLQISNTISSAQANIVMINTRWPTDSVLKSKNLE